MTARGTRRKAAQDNPIQNEAGKRALYHCNYCSRDISDVVRIKCAECADFDLCVECFSVGAELGDHKNTHAYRVMDHLSFPLFHPEWGADEEQLLLEALAMYGCGNWAGVAEHVGVKTPAQCRAHYYQIYIDPDTNPLPQPCLEFRGVDLAELMHRKLRPCEPEPREPPGRGGKNSKRASEAADDGSRPLKVVKLEDSAMAASASTTPNDATPGGPEASGADSRLGDGAGDQAAAGGKHKGGKSTAAKKTTSGQPAGPQTGQESGSGPQRIQHNKQEITGYMLLRDEFDPEYDGEAELPIAEIEFLDEDTPELTEMKLRQMDIYNERLTERERRRELIKEHQLLDVRRLMNAEKRRSPFDKRFHASMRVFARFQDTANHEALVEGLLLEVRLRARIAELKHMRRVGARTLADVDSLQAAWRKQEAIAAGRGPGRPSAASKSLAADDSAAPSAPAPAEVATPWDPSGNPATRGAALALNVWRSKRGVALDITCLPGVELLTRKERELCSAHRLLPAHYLLLKETLLREVEKNGPLTKQEARGMFRLDGLRAQRIHELAVAAGWCQAAEKLVKPGGDEGFIMDSGLAVDPSSEG